MRYVSSPPTAGTSTPSSSPPFTKSGHANTAARWKHDLRYSPSDCFETFPFPQGLWQTANPTLATLGERYHEHRRALMKSLWLGLTDIYNLFHTRDLTPAEVANVSKKPLPEAEAGYQGILELRRLHRELDLAIRDAYGWTDLDLGHDFIEVETLPENDRVRYTISPAARKEVLKRLLAENHKRAALQAQAADASAPAKKKRRQKSGGIRCYGGLVLKVETTSFSFTKAS